jgi:phage terminase large subunit GpA-like protein
MVDATKLCPHCGKADATYLMTVQDYDEDRETPASTRIYWCESCRRESRYPESEEPLDDQGRT